MGISEKVHSFPIQIAPTALSHSESAYATSANLDKNAGRILPDPDRPWITVDRQRLRLIPEAILY
jgi:hypothetical protein